MNGSETYEPPLAVKVMRISTPSLASRVVPMFETVAEGALEKTESPRTVASFNPAVWDVVKSTYARGSDATFTNAPISMRDAAYTDQLVIPASFGTVCTLAPLTS